MITYTIKPYLTAEAGLNWKSIKNGMNAINASLIVDDVTINCYRGGDVLGTNIGSVDLSTALFSNVPGRKLIINFVDPPPVWGKGWNTGSAVAGAGQFGTPQDGRYVGTFVGGRALKLRVADVTVNGFYSIGGQLHYEATMVGDLDADPDDPQPMNNGGLSDGVCVFNNCVMPHGGIKILSDGIVTATVNNSGGVLDGNFNIVVGTGVLTVNMNHVSIHGQDAGLIGSTGGGDIYLNAKNSLFGGSYGLFKTSLPLIASGKLHVTFDHCVPDQVGLSLGDVPGMTVDEDVNEDGYAFARGPLSAGTGFDNDIRPMPGSLSINAGKPGVLANDASGRPRTYSTSLGPLEPEWDDFETFGEQPGFPFLLSVDAGKAMGRLQVKDNQGDPIDGVDYTFEIVFTSRGFSGTTESFSAQSANAGILDQQFVKGWRYRGRREPNGEWIGFTVPTNLDLFSLPPLLGQT